MKKSTYKPFQKRRTVKKKWQQQRLQQSPQLTELQQHAKMIVAGNCIVKLAEALEQLMTLPRETALQAPLLLDPKNPQPEIDETLTTPIHTLTDAHPLTEFLWRYRQIDLDEMLYSYHINTLPPYCHLLLKAVPEINLREALDKAYLRVKDRFVYTLDTALRHALSDFIIQLYQERSNCWFKAIKKAYYRAEHDNLKSYTAYVKALFNKYARLLVVRVDLGYYKTVQTPYQQFMDDVDSFLKKIPYHPVFQNKAGYIWKLEYGLQKGFHVHLLVFFDGAKRRSDYHIAKQIGELWQAMAPNRCLYFNCHQEQHKASYVINCLGTVKRHDNEVIEHLQNKVIRYFTKTDPAIKLFNQNTHKLSDRGQLPKPKAPISITKPTTNPTNGHD